MGRKRTRSKTAKRQEGHFKETTYSKIDNPGAPVPQRKSRGSEKLPKSSSSLVKVRDQRREDKQHDKRRFMLMRLPPDTPAKNIIYYLEGRALSTKSPTLNSISVIVEFQEDIDFEKLKTRIKDKPLNNARPSIRKLPVHRLQFESVDWVESES